MADKVAKAKEALKKLEDQLKCSICLDTYTGPKLLQCFHAYCQQCLVKLAIRDQQGQLGITCPTCRQVTPTPDRGVAGLQSAFNINRFLEIQKSLLDNPAATLEEAVRGATVDAPSRDVVAGHCFEHKEEIKLYCETCEELICWKCALKGGKHHDHDYEEIDRAFQKYKEEITASLEPIEKQVMTIKEAQEQLVTRRGEISDQREATKDNIRVTFRQLREVFNVRETELINRLDRLTQGKLKGLATQEDQVETTLAQLNSCLRFMRESLGTGNEGDVLMMKTNTVKQIEELTTPFQPDILKPNTEADIEFSASAYMTALCQNYGLVFAPGSPDPSKCHSTGKGVELAVVGERSTALLQAINFEGEPCTQEHMKSFECELVSEITGTRASCSVERRGQSQYEISYEYEISYQPTIKGRHQLHIKAEGQHIRGSPFSVAVKSPEKLGAPILTIGGVEGPSRIAVTQKGEVVVTEKVAHCVSVFSPGGEKLRSFGTLGSDQGQFRGLCGVAVDGEGSILVADSGNNRIQKFTAEGQFLAAVGTSGSGPLQFYNPAGISCNKSNNTVCVTDFKGHRIHILNSDLTFSRTLGKEGSGKGQFRFPRGIACDSTGKVYVADSGNHRIQVFKAEGKFLRMFGRCGHGRGELDYPTSIAIGDVVYISDSGNHRVSLFTPEGQFVTSFGREGVGPGEFKVPCGVALGDNGVVYVCDSVNNSVQIF